MPEKRPLPVVRRYRGLLGRVNHEPTTWVMPLVGPLVRRLLIWFTPSQVRGGEHIPQTGPMICTPNHVSSIDPLLVGVSLAYQGRWPHFLARANLFEHPVLGWLLRSAEQIPVHRGTARAKDALVAADAALERDQAVMIYPEGTITMDPLEWPMVAHTGAARLALRTGAPVIPVGQWGANHALPPRGVHKFKLRRWAVTIIYGPPVDLSDLGGAWQDRAIVHEATVRIMDAITALVEQARGEQAPPDRWHPELERRVPAADAVR